MKQVEKERADKKKAGSAAKKPYATPTLTVHGDVEGITERLRSAEAKGEAQSTDFSDQAAKENFSPVDGLGVLARLAALPIETWNYKGESPSVRHMGPMA
jgi:hypothetical protein